MEAQFWLKRKAAPRAKAVGMDAFSAVAGRRLRREPLAFTALPEDPLLRLFIRQLPDRMGFALQRASDQPQRCQIGIGLVRCRPFHMAVKDLLNSHLDLSGNAGFACEHGVVSGLVVILWVIRLCSFRVVLRENQSRFRGFPGLTALTALFPPIDI